MKDYVAKVRMTHTIYQEIEVKITVFAWDAQHAAAKAGACVKEYLNASWEVNGCTVEEKA